MIRGSAKIDGIALGTFTANFLGTDTSVKAKAAFVDSATGSTHGWTEHEQWSAETRQKLLELRDAMERDIAARHFSDFSLPVTNGVVIPRAETPSGLGEHVAGEPKIPSI